MLTVDYDRLGVTAGDRLLDLGCGGGRHAFEALRRGARVVAFDRDDVELKEASAMLAAVGEEPTTPAEAAGGAIRGDALRLPFADGAFDRVIAAEVLEHIPDDRAAAAELARVLRPGGTMAVTVPRWLPELVCWALSSDYHGNEGGHVRIYRRGELLERLRATSLRPVGIDHTHGLHSPYWWLKCLVGVRRDDHPLARAYHRFLVWDLAQRPLLTRALDRVLDPTIGKSLVVYLEKPAVPAGAEEDRRAAA
jgi:ubiquinone/menaquinone biosynthesis C-methylase UbiE